MGKPWRSLKVRWWCKVQVNVLVCEDGPRGVRWGNRADGVRGGGVAAPLPVAVSKAETDMAEQRRRWRDGVYQGER
jgi:hypothetical protein